MKNSFLLFFQDARNLQLTMLSTFLIYGMIYLGWTFEAGKFTAIIVAGLLTQWIGIRFTGGSMQSMKSAWITVIGLCLLLQTTLVWVGILAAVFSIGVKFLLKVDGKHFFNPSNFGIVATIALTGEAWISPGQWGSGALFIFAIGGAAMLITIKVKRLGTGIAFIGTLFLLEYLRTVLYLGWDMDVLLHKFSSGSLLLFTFFMITDPVTTSRHPKARLVWASGVAVLAFLMTHWFYLYTAPLYALILLAPLTPVLNKIFHGQRFSWSTTNSTIHLKPHTS